MKEPKIIDSLDFIFQDNHFVMPLESNILVIGGNEERGKEELCYDLHLIHAVDCIICDSDTPSEGCFNWLKNIMPIKEKLYIVTYERFNWWTKEWNYVSIEKICGYKDKLIVLEEADFYLNRKIADIIVNNRESQFIICSRGHWFEKYSDISYGEFTSEKTKDGAEYKLVGKDQEEGIDNG